MMNCRTLKNGNIVYNDFRQAMNEKRTQIGFKFLVPNGVGGSHNISRVENIARKQVQYATKQGPDYCLQIEARVIK